MAPSVSAELWQLYCDHEDTNESCKPTSHSRTTMLVLILESFRTREKTPKRPLQILLRTPLTTVGSHSHILVER